MRCTVAVGRQLGRQAGRQTGRRAERQVGLHHKSHSVACMAHRELNRIAIATFFATVTAGADAVPHWLLVGSSDRARRGVWVQCLALLLLLLHCAWPAAGKRPKCMLFRLNCRFSQTSPAIVCTCGSYITAIYAANGMAHTVATVIRRTRRTYLKLLSSL